MALGPDSQQLWQELQGGGGALQSCVTCSPVSFPLLQAEGEFEGRAESSELPVPFAIASVHHGSLSRGVLATEFFGLLGERGW